MKQPKCIEYDWGKEWSLNGKPHREDGPAIEWDNGDKEWWLNGYLHRINGPAIDCDADGYQLWYLNGKEYTKKDYYRELVQRGLCTEQEAFLEML